MAKKKGRTETINHSDSATAVTGLSACIYVKS